MKPVPERQAAKAAGERFYTTGIPCRNGHLSKRYTSTGFCAKCATVKQLRYQTRVPEHPNRIAARTAADIHYSTGVPCKNGHDRRFVSNGVCVECDADRNRRYHAIRPGLAAQWARTSRLKDPTGHREAAKRWYHANKEQAQAILIRWKKANPERAKALSRAGTERRRARKANNGGTFTIADIEVLHDKQNGKCAACPSTENLEIDHVMPVALGGSSDPFNLQLLCLPCNRSKGMKHPDDWRRELATRP